MQEFAKATSSSRQISKNAATVAETSEEHEVEGSQIGEVAHVTIKNAC